MTLTLKPQHETSVIGRILETKSLIEYHNKNIAPRFHEMEKWEQKEYQNNLNDYTASFNSDKAYLMDNEGVFNEILNQYNLSVAVFINKFVIN